MLKGPQVRECDSTRAAAPTSAVVHDSVGCGSQFGLVFTRLHFYSRPHVQVGKNIPTVAKMTQGEVVGFAGGAAEQMRADGMNVLMEVNWTRLD